MILDTTVLVDLIRGDAAALERVRNLERSGALLWVPTRVLFELYEGIERSDRPDRERAKVAQVLEDYTVLAFDQKHAARAGTLSGNLIRKGEMLDPLDAQIAGVALAEDRPVLTRKVKQFERVAGLSTETY